MIKFILPDPSTENFSRLTTLLHSVKYRPRFVRVHFSRCPFGRTSCYNHVNRTLKDKGKSHGFSYFQVLSVPFLSKNITLTVLCIFLEGSFNTFEKEG